jgi:hypothetical protein
VRAAVAFAVIVACQLIVVLDSTVVNIALTQIHSSLHFSWDTDGLKAVLSDTRFESRALPTQPGRRRGQRSSLARVASRVPGHRIGAGRYPYLARSPPFDGRPG